MTRARKKRIAAVVAGVVLVVGLGFVFANREKTRLRLSYGPGEVVVTRDVVYVAGSTNPKHRLDVYAPKGATNAPVVHGRRSSRRARRGRPDGPHELAAFGGCHSATGFSGGVK